VCEPAALLSAGVKSLLCPKQKNGNVTVAVAEIPLERMLEEGRGIGGLISRSDGVLNGKR